MLCSLPLFSKRGQLPGSLDLAVVIIATNPEHIYAPARKNQHCNLYRPIRWCVNDNGVVQNPLTDLHLSDPTALIDNSLQVGLLESNLPRTVRKNMTSKERISQLSSMFVFNVVYNWFEVELNNYRQQRDITTKLALTSALVLIKVNLLTTNQHKFSVLKWFR